jgi:hypothetical protein
MARGRKTGGRQKGARNRATEHTRAAAAAAGILPLDYMLGIMRDPAADHKRRDAMAMAAAPYLHPRLTAIDPKLSPAAADAPPEKTSIRIEFVMPSHTRDDQE